MTEAARQKEFINTLKAFNNTVVTIRLYPAKAPQITNAVDRGYKALKQHLRQYGNFVVGLYNSEPVLCGKILPNTTLQSISNLILYRQLALLDLEYLIISPGIDRVSFKKLLELFSANVETIQRYGGGRPYVLKLGIDRYFPDSPEDSLVNMAAPQEESDAPSGVISTIQREDLNVLLGREKRTRQVTDLQDKLLTPEQGPQVLAAAIAAVLLDMNRKQFFGRSNSLATIFEICNKMVPETLQEEFCSEASSLLVDNLDLPRSALLIAQDFPGGMGDTIGKGILQRMSLDLFGNIIYELRQYSARYRLTQAGSSVPSKFSAKALDRLLETPKGKQHLGQEKAKSILEAGEQARRTQRVETGMQSLLNGDCEVLNNEEFSTNLPFTLQKMVSVGSDEDLARLLGNLSNYAQSAPVGTREQIIKSFAQIGENMVVENRFDLLNIIAKPLLYWVRHSDNGDFTYEKICFVLQSLMGHCWQTGNSAVGDLILSLFYQIRSGGLKKTAPVKALIERVQDKGLDRALLPELLQQCLDAPLDETVSRRLILQGPIVSRYLVETLMHTEDTAIRIRIIDLLTYGEQFLPPILLEKLQEPMPWYGKRNLLKLLSETGSDKDLESVYAHLQHEDLRVQSEAFICIYKLSNGNRKKALIRALGEAGETMKLQVIRALVPFADIEVARSLGRLLGDYAYYSEELRDTLLTSVCEVLGRCHFLDSERALNNFLTLRGSREGRKFGSQVWQSAETALHQVTEGQQGKRKQQIKAGQLRKSALGKIGSLAGSASPVENITGLKEEEKIRNLLSSGDVDEGKKRLVELIEKIANRRRFNQAEKLRELLIEATPMALTEIIKAAEIIEKERFDAVDKEHLEIWSDLFDRLTTEEFSVLYHALNHKQYDAEEIVVRKGAVKNALYFINSGKIKLYYWDKGQNILVRTLKGGEILGADTFFDASVWTLSATTLGLSEISVLGLEKLEQWKEDYPALESKLQDFCNTFESTRTFFEKSKQDRRHYKRFKIEHNVSVSLPEVTGKHGGISAKGEMSDISRGGLSFFMRISQKESARLLLGRNVKVMLQIEDGVGRFITFEGIIVAVRTHHMMEFEYSIHVQFLQPLDNSEMQNLLRMV